MNMYNNQIISISLFRFYSIFEAYVEDSELN